MALSLNGFGNSVGAVIDHSIRFAGMFFGGVSFEIWAAGSSGSDWGASPIGPVTLGICLEFVIIAATITAAAPIPAAMT